jgi:predicted double-glycine peptidase
MQLQVPYFKQDTDDSCGPAVLRMVTYFYEIPRSAREIQRLTNTDPHHGTKNSDLEEAAREMGFDVEAKNDSTLEEMRKVLEEEGLPVVANFIEPESENGHYTVVIGMDEENIILNDPLLGAEYKMPLKEFDERWKSGFEDRSHWMMIMRTEPKDPDA